MPPFSSDESTTVARFYVVDSVPLLHPEATDGSGDALRVARSALRRNLAHDVIDQRIPLVARFLGLSRISVEVKLGDA
jgi:hypothetical protein